jgi:hypothetical protein
VWVVHGWILLSCRRPFGGCFTLCGRSAVWDLCGPARSLLQSVVIDLFVDVWDGPEGRSPLVVSMPLEGFAQLLQHLHRDGLPEMSL